jgi:hypothetical protein
MSDAQRPAPAADEELTPPDIVAEFDFRLANGDIVPEEDLGARLTEVGPELAAAVQLDGGITLSNRNGNETVIFSDDIDFLINRVCLAAVEDLLAGREARVRMSSYDRVFTLTPEGGTVVIRKDDAEVARLPLRPVLAALVDCAARYLAVRGRLAGAGGPPGWVAEAAAATQALRGRVAALDAGS